MPQRARKLSKEADTGLQAVNAQRFEWRPWPVPPPGSGCGAPQHSMSLHDSHGGRHDSSSIILAVDLASSPARLDSLEPSFTIHISGASGTNTIGVSCKRDSYVCEETCHIYFRVHDNGSFPKQTQMTETLTTGRCELSVCPSKEPSCSSSSRRHAARRVRHVINPSYLHACVCPTGCGWGKLHKLAASGLMPSECTPAQFPQKRDVASLRSPHSLSATELLSLPLCVSLRACTSCGTKLHR